MNLREAMRTVRLLKRLTLEEVSKKANISATYLSAIERGKKTNFPFSIVENISKSLDIPLPLLLLLSTEYSEMSELEKFIPNIREDIKEVFYRIGSDRA